MSEELILLEREQDLATVILNRPHKLNALIKPMWQQLGEVMRSLSADDDLRCIVMRGAGDRSFAPGNDISEFKDARSNSRDAKAYGEIHHEALAAIAECRHPVVALIQGICVGGGLEIASLCDLRICGRSSRFGMITRYQDGTNSCSFKIFNRFVCGSTKRIRTTNNSRKLYIRNLRFKIKRW